MKSTNRRQFIQQSCPLLIASIVGGTLASACTKEEELTTPVTKESYTLTGQVLTINLDHSDFEPLKSRGWLNFTEQKVLILKSNNTYQAYTNRCPHEGVRNRWSYSETDNKFLCSEHNRSYKADCESQGDGGVLTYYKTELSNNELKIYLS
ncbi:MAG: Rieske 2Fe-2S domain-containing protein [Bacteroidetes bacterium]|jgi:nitrite reductase/ring-hydroxylating ferredoxin subunit|nr:Rieske 2Fe-2S domain-containing protein [Bacteroidota bacterium]